MRKRYHLDHNWNAVLRCRNLFYGLRDSNIHVLSSSNFDSVCTNPDANHSLSVVQTSPGLFVWENSHNAAALLFPGQPGLFPNLH
uniref:Uncharacterized protein n=1 Tax=Anguilla anguilla TaxID=7936 RepID=A0A0E9S0S6_ANGAN